MLLRLTAGRILYLNAVGVQKLRPLFYNPDSVRERHRPDLFQDVPDQSRHMLTSGGHVPGLASGSVCKIRSTQTCHSPEDRNDEQQRDAISASTGSPLEARYSSTISSPTRCCKSGYMWHFLDVGLRCITWNTKGLVGSVFSSKKLKLKYLRKLFDKNNNNNNNFLYLIFIKFMEETSISRLSSTES